jgi:1-aminocyclopropane-1-carboxylate deaminase/D-cysteine desulfhydrase-like pyridoxal-dependent ACC family enzyme
LLTAGVAATIVGPTGNKLTKLGAELAAAGGPPTADQMRTLGALQNRMLFGTRIGAALIGATVITMAVARYL